MSATAISSVNQGFFARSTNPSGLHLNRRGRLARFLMVLSLALVMVAAFAFKAGAGTELSQPKDTTSTFVTVTVAPGETLWLIAGALADGADLRSLVDEIVSVNSLESFDLQAGQKLRVPVR